MNVKKSDIKGLKVKASKHITNEYCVSIPKNEVGVVLGCSVGSGDIVKDNTFVRVSFPSKKDAWRWGDLDVVSSLIKNISKNYKI